MTEKLQSRPKQSSVNESIGVVGPWEYCLTKSYELISADYRQRKVNCAPLAMG